MQARGKRPKRVQLFFYMPTQSRGIVLQFVFNGRPHGPKAEKWTRHNHRNGWAPFWGVAGKQHIVFDQLLGIRWSCVYVWTRQCCFRISFCTVNHHPLPVVALLITIATSLPGVSMVCCKPFVPCILFSVANNKFANRGCAIIL